MVERILNFMNKEFSGLHEAAFLLGSAAVASQILALIRDRIFAHEFGAGAALDIYYASFRIPDFLFVSIASFVSVTVLIPFLIEKIGKNERSGKEFLDNIFTVFFAAIVVVSIGVFFLIPILSGMLFPGIEGVSRDSLIILTRIMLLSPILLGLSNLLGSITQTARNSPQINSPPPGGTSGVLSLANQSSTKNPTIFDVQSSTIRITEGAGSAVNLTSSKITASNLNFQNLSNASPPDVIRISFTLTFINNSGRNEYSYTQKFYGSASTRQ